MRNIFCMIQAPDFPHFPILVSNAKLRLLTVRHQGKIPNIIKICHIACVTVFCVHTCNKTALNLTLASVNAKQWPHNVTLRPQTSTIFFTLSRWQHCRIHHWVAILRINYQQHTHFFTTMLLPDQKLSPPKVGTLSRCMHLVENVCNVCRLIKTHPQLLSSGHKLLKLGSWPTTRHIWWTQALCNNLSCQHKTIIQFQEQICRNSVT